MKVMAQAKVNLALDVIRKREDGYHELDMIMAPISLYNTIEISPGIQDQITCDGGTLPSNSTIHKTLALLRKEYKIKGAYKIHVTKGIPDQAGLAGSSADAAAVLNAVLDEENISLSMDQKIDMAKQIGADVPFCLVNRMARVQGIGEKIHCIMTDWKVPCLLVKPNYGISTPVAFEKWHSKKPESVDVTSVQRAIEAKSYEALMQTMGNALEPAAFQIRPELEALKKTMEKYGFDRVMMSGSGSTLMGFSQNKECYDKAQAHLENQGYFIKTVVIG